MIPSEPRGPDPRPEDQREELRGELREFLAQAAVSLVLEGSGPPKPDEKVQPAPPSPRTRSHHPPRLAPLLVILLAAASAIAIVHWWPEPVRLPDALQGRWTTTASSFTGRELIIGSHTLGFRVDPEEPEQIYPITARRISTRGDTRDVRIEYDTPEGRFTVVLSLSPDGIRLANRSEVLWTRAESTPPGQAEKLRVTPIHFRARE